MIFNIPVGGKAKATVNVYGAASETVTLTDAKGNVFSTTTNGSGKGGSLELPVGTYTIKGGYTGHTKSVTISKDTTAVYAMPNGTVVFWYGYQGYSPSAAAYVPSGATTSNGRAPEMSVSGREIFIKQGAGSGNWVGAALFSNVKTNGGVPTLKSSGKLNTSGSPPYIFFTCGATKSVGYGETTTTLSKVSAGTYSVAISAQNNGVNAHGMISVYAVYIAE